jgi:H+/Na+-translocating ferredoxin:NAD+ oxidoreductase subunit B
MPTANDIDALLPQTQCTRCGYEGCRPYAEAIAGDRAPINQCPPGGAATIAALATLMRREKLPLNPANGIEGPALVAVIDEDRCIGCVKCLPPCPVDAIVGARKQMHTVIASVCTGCELCIAPCPVDCIAMVPRGVEPSVSAAPSVGPAASTRAPIVPTREPARSGAPSPQLNRMRYYAHTARLTRRAEEQAALLAARKQAAHGQSPTAEAS